MLAVSLITLVDLLCQFLLFIVLSLFNICQDSGYNVQMVPMTRFDVLYSLCLVFPSIVIV